MNHPEIVSKFNLKFHILKIHRSALHRKISQRIVQRFSGIYASADL